MVLEKETTDSFFVDFNEGVGISDVKATRLVYNRMILLQSGSGKVSIDDVEFTLGTNQLFIISKGQVISFGEEVLLSGYTIGFGDCFWLKTPSSAHNCKAVLFNNAAFNQLLVLASEDRKELEVLFGLLYAEFSKPPYINKIDSMAAYLKIIMIKVANINASLNVGIDSSEKQLFRQFIELISLNYQTCHEVSQYASMMNISTRRLSELSKRCSGKGSKQLINGQLVAEAKRSLQFSSQAVKEIAYQLNFSTPEQFSHFFKKNANISPQEYRRKFVTMES